MSPEEGKRASGSGQTPAFEYSLTRHGLEFRGSARMVEVQALGGMTEAEMDHVQVAISKWCEARSLPQERANIYRDGQTMKIDMPVPATEDSVTSLAELVGAKLDEWEQGQPAQRRGVYVCDDDEAGLPAGVG